jgi:outer membrane protein assembly factor BamB
VKNALYLLLWLGSALGAGADLQPLISTYLGDGQRNFYGNRAPDRLKMKWRTWLGSGQTHIGKTTKTWQGAGWTGQPLIIAENGELFLIQPSLDHHLRKIRASDGKVIWKVNLGDSIKGTPTFMDLGAGDPKSRYLIMAGCRNGFAQDFATGTAHSLRGTSYLQGTELWRLQVDLTDSNSRDVDGSPLVMGERVVAPLENGYLAILDPRTLVPREDGSLRPKVLVDYRLYKPSDLKIYRHELSNEASPTLRKGIAYLPAGCGRLYSYSSAGLGWDFRIGGDLNSTMPLTSDDRFLVGIEKQFIPGQGGVMKVIPGKSGAGAIEWFYPLPTTTFYEWQGGLVGSVAINDRYQSDVPAHFACFIGVDGVLTVVDHQRIDPGRRVKDPLWQYDVPTPVVLDQAKLPAGSISTPLFLGNRILVPHDKGLDLFSVSPAGKLKHLDSFPGRMFDATPVCWDGRVYAASRDGYLYCLGE